MSGLRSAGVTDTGRRRRRNEDSYVCEPPLFAIADGMGGARAGEVASRLATSVLQEADGRQLSHEELVALIQEANRRVFERSTEDEETSGMGTTMTVALVHGSTVAFGHVGDSRAYRVRGGAIEQLTDDHSLVGELVRSGRLSPQEAEVHPQRSVITRALGTEPDVDVDTFAVEAEPGDVYLLCSDGLTDMLSDSQILGFLDGAEDPDAAARRLVEAANSSGGEDNITVVVFEIAGGVDAEETMRLPAAAASTGADPERDDDDTLTGLEAAPAVDTAVVPAEAIREHLEQQPEPVLTDQQRKARRARESRSILPLVLLVLILLALAVLVIWGLYR